MSGSLKYRGPNSNVQRVGKIDSAFRFEPASGMLQHEIGKIDSACFGCGTFPGRMRTIPARLSQDFHRGTRRKRSRPLHRDISPVQSSLPLHRADQILAANAMSGRERVADAFPAIRLLRKGTAVPSRSRSTRSKRP